MADTNKIPVKFFKKTKEEIDIEPVVDGQILFATDEKEIHLDHGDERINFSEKINLTNGDGIAITGNYPNLTITNTNQSTGSGGGAADPSLVTKIEAEPYYFDSTIQLKYNCQAYWLAMGQDTMKIKRPPSLPSDGWAEFLIGIEVFGSYSGLTLKDEDNNTVHWHGDLRVGGKGAGVYFIRLRVGYNYMFATVEGHCPIDYSPPPPAPDPSPTEDGGPPVTPPPEPMED